MSSTTVERRARHWLAWALASTVLGLLSGCGGATAQPAVSAHPTPELLLAQLPQLPLAGLPGRQAAVAQPSTINGADFFQKSEGASVSDTALSLSSTAQEIEWGIYQFDTAGSPLISVKVDFTPQSGSSVWLALSNFTRQAWDLSGPYTAGTVIPLGDSNVSSGDLFYFGVVVFDGTELLIDSSTVIIDAPVVVPFDINMTGGFDFDPQTANVDAGTVITWHNQGAGAHTATVDPLNVAAGGPNSDIEFPAGVAPGGSYSFQVPNDAASGTQWFYRCRFHASPGDGTSLGTGMVGVIVVN